MTDTHAHCFQLWTTVHHAPTGPYPAHTSFVALTCQCGLWHVFPPQNFALTTPAFQAEFRKAAAAAGLREES